MKPDEPASAESKASGNFERGRRITLPQTVTQLRVTKDEKEYLVRRLKEEAEQTAKEIHQRIADAREKATKGYEQEAMGLLAKIGAEEVVNEAEKVAAVLNARSRALWGGDILNVP